MAGRIALLIALAAYGFICFRSPGTFRLLDSVDLAIHETGHLVFAPFGEWMGMAGGTMFQLLVPAAFAARFLWRGDWYAAAVCLWWVAQNCWNISVYVADARAQELPLVGGGEHDWEYLLTVSGDLANDQVIARRFHAVGVLIYATAIAVGVISLRRDPAAVMPAEEPASAQGRSAASE